MSVQPNAPSREPDRVPLDTVSCIGSRTLLMDYKSLHDSAKVVPHKIAFSHMFVCEASHLSTLYLDRIAILESMPCHACKFRQPLSFSRKVFGSFTIHSHHAGIYYAALSSTELPALQGCARLLPASR